MKDTPKSLTYSINCVTDGKGVTNAAMSYSDSEGVRYKTSASSDDFDKAIRTATRSMLSGIVDKYNKLEQEKPIEKGPDPDTLLKEHNDLMDKYDQLKRKYDCLKDDYDKLLDKHTNHVSSFDDFVNRLTSRWGF